MNNLNTFYPNRESDFIAEIFKAENRRLIDPSYKDQLDQPYNVRVASYIRVSTPDQAREDKVSLDIQEQQIKEFINNQKYNNQKWELYATYCDEGISGKNMEKRDDFRRMIDDAKQGKFDVIVGWTADRLARNVDEMTFLRSDLKKFGVQITTVKEPTEIINPKQFAFQQHDGIKKFLAYVLDWKAEQDNIDRVRRFEAGKMGKAQKGKIPVKCPYGYKKVVWLDKGDPVKKEKDEIVESEALIVKEIFELYDKRSLGIKKIAEHLNFKKIPSPNGRMWCYSTVKYTLQNPTYTGLVRFGWRLARSKENRARLQQGHKGIISKGEHKVIIEPDQFKKVQEKMTLRKKLGGRAASSRGILSGILKCGRCGGGTYLKTYPNWYSYTKKLADRGKYKPAKAYSCSRYQNYGKSGCSKSWVIYAEKIERIVIEKIKNLAESEEARKEFILQMKKNNTQALKTKLRDLNKIPSQLNERYKRLKTAYMKGAITLEEFTQDKNGIEMVRQKNSKEIEDTKINLLKEEKIAFQSETALMALADFEKSWSTANFDDRKLLLHTILDKVVVKDNNIQIYFSQASSV